MQVEKIKEIGLLVCPNLLRGAERDCESIAADFAHHALLTDSDIDKKVDHRSGRKKCEDMKRIKRPGNQ
jgi:hypothetical protein